MRKTRNILRYLVVLALNILIMLVFHSYANFLLLIVQLVFPFYSIYAVRAVGRSLALKISGPLEPVEREHLFYGRT